MGADGSGGKGPGKRLPRIKGWFFVLTGLAIGAAYFYYLHIEERKDFINSFYFRTLQEVTTEFNENLSQLETLHRYGQCESTIQSIFTSYRKDDTPTKEGPTEEEDGDAGEENQKGGGKDGPVQAGTDGSETENTSSSTCGSRDDTYTYTLEANRIKIVRLNTAKEETTFFVDIGDLMPKPGNDFEIYVIADTKNRVLGGTGGQAGLSIINTNFISRAIQVRENQDWLKLATRSGAESVELDRELPGYSTQIDVELNTGKARVFVLPFVLFHEIQIPKSGNPEQDLDFENGVPMFLVGVQPDEVIDSYENKRWNFSLLLLSLVGLVFLWTVTRLLMLSRHQPLGNNFYRVTVVASYFTFILLVALLAAFAHRSGEIELRQQKAIELTEAMGVGVERDLSAVFESLEDFRLFYGQVLDERNLKESASTDLDCKPTRTCIGPCVLIETEDGYEACEYRPGNEQEQASHALLGSDPLHRLVTTLKENSTKFPDTVIVESRTRGDINLPRYSNTNVYPEGVHLSLDSTRNSKEDMKVIAWYDPAGVKDLPGEGRLLGVFLMNEVGRQVLPVFFFTENNLRPQSYNLAHRDYFRRVRDRAGWTTNLTDSPAGQNFYIQRLLNLNTGTRGTTIGMPLGDQAPGDKEHFLGADIVLPTLSVQEWTDAEAVQDMVVMVIDRVSGQVLFHMEDKRSMVENLYQAGKGSAKLRQAIKAGRFPRRRALPGYYHGESGSFVAAPLPISQWATVVFIPDASTDSLMTNTFLVSVIGMGAALLLLAGVLGLVRRSINTETRKFDWGIPGALNGHGLMMFASILIGSVYLAYWLSEVVSEQVGLEGQSGLSMITIALAAAVVLWWGYTVVRRLQAQDRRSKDLKANASAGVTYLLVIFALTSVGMMVYLNHVGNKPDSGLSWYYRNLAVARLNMEKKELRDIALTRYPNTIKEHGGDPLRFVPIKKLWYYECLESPDYWTGTRNKRDEPEMRKKEPNVMPEHIGTFSQYTASTDPLSWMNRYLLMGDQEARDVMVCQSDGSPAKPNEAETDDRSLMEKLGNFIGSNLHVARFLAVMISAFLLLCAGWYLFYRWVLGARLFGSAGLAEHLRYIVEHNVPERAYAPRPGLVLDLRCQRHAGEDFAGLLHRCSSDAERDKLPDPTCRGMKLLMGTCPWLKQESTDSDPFPGACISFVLKECKRRSDADGKPAEQLVSVQLSDLDVCLSEAKVRMSLLRLLRQLKALYLAGQLSELRVDLGFHSYESLLLKAHNTYSEREPMSQAEFANWAETLMDFQVKLPEELTDQIDHAFVHFECRGSGLLRRLEKELNEGKDTPKDIDWRRKRRWLKLHDVDKTGQEWATINCILLKAGALFRHKWETCSSAEKLALYYLARRKRINSANAQLLEQMSLQGLIRVDHGGIRIVNNSLAYFARHAEDADTLKNLVQIGEVGTWQEYRLPVTLVILLLLGGIAFTSGSSMYMIVASLLGLLGTIGSLTSSARMIKENLR